MNKTLQIEQIRDRLEQCMDMPVSDGMVERVALYYTALKAMTKHEQHKEVEEMPQPEPLQAVQSEDGAWRKLVRGKDMQAVADVMDRHFEVISAVAPKHYAAVLAALDKI